MKICRCTFIDTDDGDCGLCGRVPHCVDGSQKHENARIVCVTHWVLIFAGNFRSIKMLSKNDTLLLLGLRKQGYTWTIMVGYIEMIVPSISTLIHSLLIETSFCFKSEREDRSATMYFYLLLNNCLKTTIALCLDDIAELMDSYGLKTQMALSRQCGREYLYILKITR